jgi:hypothetical protein
MATFTIEHSGDGKELTEPGFVRARCPCGWTSVWQPDTEEQDLLDTLAASERHGDH